VGLLGKRIKTLERGERGERMRWGKGTIAEHEKYYDDGRSLL